MKDKNGVSMEMFGKKIALMAVLIAVGIYMVASMVVVVDAGHTGVKKTLGKVSEESYPPGFYMVIPVISSITSMDNRIQRLDDKTNVYTKDVQQADISYALNYSLAPTTSVKMYSEVGMDWSAKLIPQVITGSLKNVIGQWNALEIVANRSKASQDIENMISKALSERGIMISGFALTNIDFQPEFEEAVEAKVVAVQKAEMAKNQTVQIEENAKQRVIAAEADAKAMMIKTDALTKNQSLIMYEAVQKWDGALPKIIGGNGGNLLNIPEGLLK